MYRRMSDFLSDYAEMRQATLRLFGALGDENLGQTVETGHRTLGQIAWHIVVSIPEMMNLTGLALASVDHESSPPVSASEIVSAYELVSSELLESAGQEWDDDALLTEDSMYGQTWRKGKTLSVLLTHEVHHRAQMTVLLRQAGARVPGLLGPSKEEWVDYGLETPAY